MPSSIPRDGHTGRWVLAFAALAFVARLPLLGVPLSSDEAGFLLVAGQWSPGSSLYGDYFVDRPPGLVSVFAVADALGGRTALRLIGGLFAAASVLAAAWLARVVAPERREAAAAVAVTTAALLSSGLLNVSLVNGEVLALPLVLAGLAALLSAARPRADRAVTVGVRWAAGAGACGAAAVMVKQKTAYVPVAAVLVLAVVAVRAGLLPTARLAAGLLAGVVAVVVPLVLLSASRGTDLSDLWYAVVTFRVEAGTVISETASDATTTRAWKLAGSVLLSGAPLALALLWRRRWRRHDGHEHVVTWLCVLVAAYGALSIVAGGSYWLHYLVQVVPAVVLLVATSFREDAATPRRLRTLVVGVVVASGFVAYVAEVVHPRTRDADEIAVVDYLRAHADAGPRTAVVAFGNSWVIADAGMTSPYSELWSLPVRVRDPRLSTLSAVLDGPDRPTWLVLYGTGLDSWGIDATDATEVVDRRYTEVFTDGDYTVLEALESG